jgi:hypothetical protein
MIPSEIAALCKIIDKSWPDMDESDFKVVLEIAYDVFNAGYRLPVSRSGESS